MIPIDAFRAGDDATFRALVRDESGRLLAIARRYAADPDEADDLLQQSWLAIWRSREQYDGRGSLTGWMMTICRNTCLAHVRSRNVRPRNVPAPDVSAAPGGPPVDLAAAIDDAIAGLPPRERDVVVLRLLEGCSTRETARRLDCAEGTVKATLHHATRKLRDILRNHR